MMDGKYVRWSRLLFLGVLRSFAVIWICINTGYAIVFLMYELFDGYMTYNTEDYVLSGATYAIYCGTGLGLWFLAPWLVTKLFHYTLPKCPSCLFSLENFKTDRCPECGLYLGEDFHAPEQTSLSTQSTATETPE
tara:strand:+ start:231 stop:635 length:405 start_codon:yes stop_codon:yes gene_type:complete